MTTNSTLQPGEVPDLSRLVADAEQAHSRAEAMLAATIDGIETAMGRLAHLGRVAAIARAVRAEAERDRLRALLEEAGGDPAAAEIARLRAELAEARAEGRCGARPQSLLESHEGPEPTCTLHALHHGWHKDASTGAEWTPEPGEIEYAIEVQEDTGYWGWVLTDPAKMRTPAGVVGVLERCRAKNPEYRYRAVVRAVPPYRPLTDAQLAELADTEAGR